MKTFARAFALILAINAGPVHADFDYAQCASIEDVRVPYEIVGNAGIRFLRDDRQQLSVTDDGEILDARNEPLAISPELKDGLSQAIRDFVEIGTRFAERFGRHFGDGALRPDEIDQLGDAELELYSDSCRNLYALKQVQETVGEQDDDFQPVIIVDGF